MALPEGVASKWRSMQQEYAKQLILEDDVPWVLGPRDTATATATSQQVEENNELLKYVGGLDISFYGDQDPATGYDRAVVALVVLDFQTLQVVHERLEEVVLEVPYVPGFLGFREWPSYHHVLQAVRGTQFDPQVLMVDGFGVLHHQGCGSASQLGLLSGYPAIGVAKSLLAVDGLQQDPVDAAMAAALPKPATKGNKKKLQAAAGDASLAPGRILQPGADAQAAAKEEQQAGGRQGHRGDNTGPSHFDKRDGCSGSHERAAGARCTQSLARGEAGDGQVASSMGGSTYKRQSLNSTAEAGSIAACSSIGAAPGGDAHGGVEETADGTAGNGSGSTDLVLAGSTDVPGGSKVTELSGGLGHMLPLVGTSGRLWGAAVCSRSSRKPVFVSVGHRLSLDTAVEVVARCCRHRIPEPIRHADLRSRDYIRRQLSK